jgi:hypothetical protein
MRGIETSNGPAEVFGQLVQRREEVVGWWGACSRGSSSSELPKLELSAIDHPHPTRSSHKKKPRRRGWATIPALCGAWTNSYRE